MNNLLNKKFIFFYNTGWSEAELLQHFIKEIKVHSNLHEMPQICYMENLKGKRTYIRSILLNYETFKEMNLFIQKFFVSFNLAVFRYPVFLAVSYALQNSFLKNKHLKNTEIYFEVFWEYPLWDNKYLSSGITAERYKHERELPLNDVFYWSDSVNNRSKK